MMLFHGAPLDCINQAAIRYHVPAAVIVSVIQTEKGRNGMAIKNKNGTYDLGIMQVNTSWVPKLAKHGINIESVQSDPCVNIQVGTWILAQGIARNDGWQGVANYHSSTPKHNQQYQERIKNTYSRYVEVLERQV